MAESLTHLRRDYESAFDSISFESRVVDGLDLLGEA